MCTSHIEASENSHRTNRIQTVFPLFRSQKDEDFRPVPFQDYLDYTIKSHFILPLQAPIPNAHCISSSLHCQYQ